MRDSIDVSVIIVNWNSREYLRKCIDSIRANTHVVRYEIVVIDSGSFDGCGEMLGKDYPEVRFIQSKANLGFARANNLAFQESVGKCVLFLNPDTELVDAAIDNMRLALQQLTAAGAIGCKLLNSDGTIQTSCVQTFPTILNKVLDSEFLRARWPRSPLWGTGALFDDSAQATRVEAISGACVMLDRAVFTAVGGFSEEFFMYAEDIDLSYKTTRAGYMNYYLPTATVMHHGGSSSEQATSRFSNVMMPEATWRFLRKTRGLAYALGYRVGMGVSAAVRLVLLGLAWMTGQRRQTHASISKWLSILRWSVAGDGLVRRYYPRDRRPSYQS